MIETLQLLQLTFYKFLYNQLTLLFAEGFHSVERFVFWM